jgi:hypothetical protein
VPHVCDWDSVSIGSAAGRLAWLWPGVPALLLRSIRRGRLTYVSRASPALLLRSIRRGRLTYVGQASRLAWDVRRGRLTYVQILDRKAGTNLWILVHCSVSTS